MMGVISIRLNHDGSVDMDDLDVALLKAWCREANKTLVITIASPGRPDSTSFSHSGVECYTQYVELGVER